MKYGDDFISIEDDFSSDIGSKDDLIYIEDDGYISSEVPRSESFEAFVKNDIQVQGQEGQGQDTTQVDTNQPDVLQPDAVNPVDTVDDQDIIPKDTTDWSARASEIVKDLEFLGYTPSQINGKEDFYVVQDQIEFVRDEMDNNKDLTEIIGKINMPPVNFLESEIRASLGVFATDDDVANKLSTFLNEDGSLNENGTKIYGNLKSSATSKAQAIVDDIKSRSAVYAKSNLDFYRKIEESVVNFSYPSVSFEINGTTINIPVVASASDKRKLYSFMQSGYTDTANGEGVENRASFLAENAFLLNRELFNKFISEVAASAYKKGESETLKTIKK